MDMSRVPLTAKKSVVQLAAMLATSTVESMAGLMEMTSGDS